MRLLLPPPPPPPPPASPPPPPRLLLLHHLQIHSLSPVRLVAVAMSTAVIQYLVNSWGRGMASRTESQQSSFTTRGAQQHVGNARCRSRVDALAACNSCLFFFYLGSKISSSGWSCHCANGNFPKRGLQYRPPKVLKFNPFYRYTQKDTPNFGNTPISCFKKPQTGPPVDGRAHKAVQVQWQTYLPW